MRRLLTVLGLTLLIPATASAATPVARFTWSPVAPQNPPVTVAFDGTTSTCDAPCTYSWKHGTTQFATGSTATFTYQATGTKTVTLTIKDRRNRTSTVPHSFDVTTSQPPADSDGDGVPDSTDLCPGTPVGTPVDSTGCPVVTGTVLWKADAELPLNQEWAEYSTAPHCAVTSDTVASDTRFFEQSAVVAKGASAYQASIVDGDDCFNERAEVGQDYPTRPGFSESRRFVVGNDYWVSFQVYLAPGYPVSTPNWNLVAQWKQIPGGVACCPFMALHVHDGAFYWENAGANRPGVRLKTATTGVWTKLTVHMKISSTSTGYVAVFDPSGTLMPETAQPTTDTNASGTPLDVSARIGIYRNGAAIAGNTSVYYDGYTVATTRAAAEANAF